MTFPDPDDQSTSQVPLGSGSFDDVDEDAADKPVEEETGGSLRAELKKRIASEKAAQEQIEELKQSALVTAYTSLGLDVTKGIGKAASMIYDGEPEGLAEFVETEFEYLGPENPVAGHVAFEQAALDAASSGAGSVPVETADDELAKAEARGDWTTALEIKGQRIQQQLQGR